MKNKSNPGIEPQTDKGKADHEKNDAEMCTSSLDFPPVKPFSLGKNTRRRLLQSALSLTALAGIPRLAAASAPPRIAIIGGGWGGLAAARRLREWVPHCEITLIERKQRFHSHPLSNRWLVGLASDVQLSYDYGKTAQRHGYRWLQSEVRGIDRDSRRVETNHGSVNYDWLVVAPGIREDFSPWFGVDRDSADFCRQHYPSAFADSAGLMQLKATLENFRGGDLVMTIPPMPYRCPPAPYERAILLAWWLKREKIPGRLVILDPNLPAMAFDRIFRDSYRDQILYLPQAGVRQLDPYRRQIVTEFDTIDFTAAILMPIQQAADIAWQAGLTVTTDGKNTNWAALDPVHLHIPGDERVFIVGDACDRVSPLFGYYPKTGQIAARQGQIAAAQIAARIAGQEAPRTLPDSRCVVIQRAEPLEMTQIDTQYRFRGDGVIQQTIRQQHLPQSEHDDLHWANGMFAELGLTN